MKLIGLMTARNEDWIIETSVRCALQWVDRLLVLEHACTDRTSAILERLQEGYKNRLVRIGESSPDWNEADYRQRMLRDGRDLGGTHFAIIDADEILTRNLFWRIEEMAMDLLPGDGIRLPWVCMWRKTTQFRSDDSKFGRASTPLLFRDHPSISHQCKDNYANYQIHTRLPQGVHLKDADMGPGGLLHFQHASWRRVLAKQALYKMVERIRWDIPAQEINSRYDPTVCERGIETTPLPPAWLETWAIEGIHATSTPWQEAECRRLMVKHGKSVFAGLNLYGVV